MKQTGPGPGPNTFEHENENENEYEHEHDRMGALTGTVVLDLSRMLPGAVLDRMLLELGARLLKVESPAGGDPLRGLGPQAREGEDGGGRRAGAGGEGGGGPVGAGFAALLAGAESLALDLARAPAAAAVRRLAARADVLVESFRPGTLARWGLDPADLAAGNPRLVVCSLSSFGSEPPWSPAIGHDLNFAALSGLLSLLAVDAPPAVPGAQLADVTAGLLACSSILAALLERERTGRGRIIEQPLATGPLPFLTWPWADADAAARANAGADAGGGAGSGANTRALPTRADLLTGRSPTYRLYACAGGERVALGAIEPKLWLAFLELVGLPELAAAGLDPGEVGHAAGERVQARLARQTRARWLALARERGIPLSAVNDVAAGLREPYYATRGGAAAPWLGAADRAALAGAPAPALGEHTESVLREFGLTPEEITAARGR